MSGWNSLRYSLTTAGVSRAGSQVINTGRKTFPQRCLTRSIMTAILSNSSGHMSGQCVKPKYTYDRASPCQWWISVTRGSTAQNPYPHKNHVARYYMLRTRAYLPRKFSWENVFPFWSTRSKGPPTFGFPTPFVDSAILFRANRSFSYRKYIVRPTPEIRKRSPAGHENGWYKQNSQQIALMQMRDCTEMWR